MFSKYDKCVELLSCLKDKPRVVPEVGDASFITSVKENGSFFIPILLCRDRFSSNCFSYIFTLIILIFNDRIIGNITYTSSINPVSKKTFIFLSHAVNNCFIKAVLEKTWVLKLLFHDVVSQFHMKMTFRQRS